MKSFLVSDHATQKIWERQINWKDIPDLTNMLKPGRHKIVKRIAGQELVAIYKIDKEKVVLMTTYWRDK